MSTRTTRRALPFLLALLALGTSPVVARAQSVVDRIAAEATRLMTEAGMKTRSQHDGSLPQGRATDITVNIAAGSQILIAGFCDEDCSDLDMRVIQNGTTLGEDILDDDAPMVALPNWAGGTVTVRVEMPGCSVAPCAFRVLVFGK
ncbi:MAG TPA: hypothetical protein PK788_04750 [Gemmatimonadaceae bacterium]|nr:hypothetical protein [Gemmatimonadaceae bacterium]HRQ77642.1 hypothetical protein [Gemmatimonadaceae bacterium]